MLEITYSYDVWEQTGQIFFLEEGKNPKSKITYKCENTKKPVTPDSSLEPFFKSINKSIFFSYFQTWKTY